MTEILEKEAAVAEEAAAKKSPTKKPTAKKATEKVAEGEKTTAKKPAAKKTAATKASEPAAAEKAPEAVAAKTAKKNDKKSAKQPLYVNGRYIVEKAAAEKPKAGAHPYPLTDKKIKVTLVKSTNSCLESQKRTVEALGLSKIRSCNVLPDNAAIRGMIFKVKHLVVVEEVK